MTITDGELVADQAWTDRAVCSGHIQWFFAPPGERQRDRRAREYVARHICGQCPVLGECRDHARRHGEWGFWGGESEHERIAAGYPPTLSLQRGRNDHRVAASAVDDREAPDDDTIEPGIWQAS
jgi:WhiB family transcriptional regulator, redox-sensing transcriptional regulator